MPIFFWCPALLHIYKHCQRIRHITYILYKHFIGFLRHCIQNTPVTTIEIETTNGELIPVSTLVVPTIAAPIQNAIPIALSSMPHLQGLKQVHPVTSDKNFTISILIGADYYWKFVQDTIIRGDGPIAQESRLSYLLSGPLPCSLSQSAASILLQMSSSVQPEQPNLETFWSVERIGTTAHTSCLDLTFLHNYQQSSITRSNDDMFSMEGGQTLFTIQFLHM